MKAFSLAAVGAALASAKTREFVMDKEVISNGSSGQFVRLSDPTNKAVWGTAATTTKFELTTWGVYYEDTGLYKVRLMAELTAPIFAKDEVTFEINYRVGSIAAAKDNSSIGEDQVKCVMTQNSADKYFWKP